jgi:GntR family transcriptional regulator of abcA and norABC
MFEWHLDESSGIPAYLQLTDYLREQINSGILKDKTVLPGRRKLHKILHVSEITVRSALEQLQFEGLLVSAPKSGVKVNFHAKQYGVNWLRCISKGRHKVGNEEYSRWAESDSLTNIGLSREFDVYPYMHDAAQNAMCHQERGITTDEYSKFGLTALRESILEHVRCRGINTNLENILICSDSLGVLSNIYEIFMSTGSSFLYGNPNVMITMSNMHSLGVNLVPMALDKYGLSSETLEKQIILNRQNCVLFIEPTDPAPTGIVMSRKRREDISALIEKYKLPVVEFERPTYLCHDNPSLRSLKSMDKHDNVIYIGTFPLFEKTDFQITWIIADKYLLEHFSNVFIQNGAKPNFFIEMLVSEMMCSGEFARLAKDIKQFITHRRAITLELCNKYLKNICEYNEANCWYHFWLKFKNINIRNAFRKIAVNTKIFPGYFFDRQDTSHVMLAPSSITETSIEEAIMWLSKLEGK